MAFDSSAVRGLAAAKAAFRNIDPVLKEKLADANGQTAQMIAFKAQQNVRRRTGTLARHIRWTVSKVTGIAKVGIGPREAVAIPGQKNPEFPTHIAHLIEFGHGGPHPAGALAFMIPAAESEREAHLDRVRTAGQQTEQQLGGFGGGLL